jgi:hypothetical protein
MAPVLFMEFNFLYKIVISTDEKGIIEYWDSDTYGIKSFICVYDN